MILRLLAFAVITLGIFGILKLCMTPTPESFKKVDSIDLGDSVYVFDVNDNHIGRIEEK